MFKNKMWNIALRQHRALFLANRRQTNVLQNEAAVLCCHHHPNCFVCSRSPAPDSNAGSPPRLGTRVLPGLAARLRLRHVATAPATASDAPRLFHACFCRPTFTPAAPRCAQLAGFWPGSASQFPRLSRGLFGFFPCFARLFVAATFCLPLVLRIFPTGVPHINAQKMHTFARLLMQPAGEKLAPLAKTSAEPVAALAAAATTAGSGGHNGRGARAKSNCNRRPQASSPRFVQPFVVVFFFPVHPCTQLRKLRDG